MIGVEIASIVKNLDSNIDFLQPLYESIMNSLQANAKNIHIVIYESESLSKTFKPTMIGFSITDDGDGFTEENIKSFCTLWSTHKFLLGCKGSGRFTWLNVYNSINITSKLKNGKTIKIPFSIDFDDSKIERISSDIASANSTTIDFRYVTNKYYRLSEGNKKGFDKRCEADASYIKESIIDYLFVTFDQLKAKRIPFSISIQTSSTTETITKNDIKALSKIDFNIENDFNGHTQHFVLKYLVKNDKQANKKIVLCSNDRSAHNVMPSSVGINANLPNSDSIFVYLTSPYLDGLDTDDRRGLDTYASSNKAEDILYSISYSRLLSCISITLKNLIKKLYPSTTKENDAIINRVIEEKPYLKKFIQVNDSAILSHESVENSAIKTFEKAKIEASKKFAAALTDRELDEEKFAEAIADLSSVSAAELGEYIIYRSQILDALSDNCLASKNEEYLHNIFMPKRTSSDNDDYLDTNMWIIDDKFMSYLYAASDIEIRKINKEAFGLSGKNKHDMRRPDTFVVYDRKEGIKNAIIIEYKAYSTDLDQKFKSIRELPDDIAVFRKSNKEINSIWAYVITQIDDDFLESIKNQGTFKELFTTKNSKPSFYRFNEAINAHIYICDIRSIVEEARVRNSVFSSIIEKRK